MKIEVNVLCVFDDELMSLMSLTVFVDVKQH